MLVRGLASRARRLTAVAFPLRLNCESTRFVERCFPPYEESTAIGKFKEIRKFAYPLKKSFKPFPCFSFVIFTRVVFRSEELATLFDKM